MPAVIVRTITDITRRRRGRQTRLREEAREESVYLVEPRGSGGGVVCPVCGRDVSGDEDVVEAHVDACLAYESRRVEMERRVESERRMGRGTEWAMGDGDGLVDVDVDVDGSEGNGGGEDGSIRTRVVALGSLRGTGIHMRTETLDTEDDIDVDGTDDTLFGDAQFGEEDILVLAADGRKGDMEMMDSQVEDSSELDLAILAARKTGDQLGLIAALEAKVKSTVRCSSFVLVSHDRAPASIWLPPVGYVSRRIRTLRYLLAVGTLAARRAGSSVWGPRSCVRCVRGSRVLQS